MAITIPDKGEGVSIIQSILFQEDFDVCVQNPALGTYVKTGCAVSAQAVPNMSVQVLAGEVYSRGYKVFVTASASLPIAAADAVNPRLDYVVATASGALAVRAGTPMAYVAGTSTPKPPTLTAGDVALSQVLVLAASLAITAAHLYDRRVEVPNLQMFQAEAGGWDNTFHLLPSSGTGLPSVRGSAVSVLGTVSHPGPSAVAPARLNQLHRLRYANVATTANQLLGFYQNSGLLKSFWRGNAANLGGFYFRGKMFIELMPAATIRYWLGMDSGTVGVSISNVLSGDLCGLWHDTSMLANVLYFVTRDNVTTNLKAIPLAAPLAAGQGYELIMYCKPNDTVLYYQVIDMLTGLTLARGATSTNLPRNNIFMGPEGNMSNGANAVVTTTAPGVVECFVGQPAIRA